MQFTDIHNHSLYGVDDGAKTVEDSCAMISALYEENVRTLCFTPHFNPGYYGNNGQRAREAFEEMKKYCAEKHPDLKLYLGNELHYNKGCNDWLLNGLCNTMNGDNIVLVDFSEGETAANIVRALEKMLNAGYKPILAHCERYRFMSPSLLAEIKRKGVLLQMNAASPIGCGLSGKTRKSRRLLANKLIDFISTDAHNLTSRPPSMKKSYDFVSKKYGGEYADRLFGENAKKLIFTDI